MISLVWSIFRRNLKRNVQSIIGGAVALCYAIVLLSFTQNYTSAQFENAYRNSGRWDLRVRGLPYGDLPGLDAELSPGQTRGVLVERETALLDPLTEKEKVGPSAALASNWLLAIKACDAQACQMLPNRLLRGRWPDSPDEIVLPNNFVLDGKHLQAGDFDLGDAIRMTVGIRQLTAGDPTQNEQLSPDETYRPDGQRTFTLVGVWDSSERVNGIFATHAYTGLVRPDTQQKVTVLLHTGLQQSGAMQDFQAALARRLNLSEGQVVLNTLVDNTLRLLETADITRAYQNVAWILVAILLVLTMAIVFNHQIMLFRSNRRQIALLRINGASAAQVARVFGFHALIVAGFAALLGIGAAFGLAAAHRAVSSQAATSASSETIVFRQFDWSWTAIAVLALLGATSVSALIQVAAVFRNPISHGLQLQAQRRLRKVRAPADTPTQLRIMARTPLQSLILSFTLVLSLSILAAGTIIMLGANRKAEAVLRTLSYDFTVIQTRTGFDSTIVDQMKHDLPDATLIDTDAVPIQMTLPRAALAAAFLPKVDSDAKEIVFRTSLISVNQGLFAQLLPGAALSYAEFAAGEQCIVTRHALISANMGTVGQSGRTTPGQNIETREKGTNHQEIQIHDLTAGSALQARTFGQTPRQLNLTVAAVIAQGHVPLIADDPAPLIYIPEAYFRRLMGDDTPYNRVINIQAPPASLPLVAQYLSSHQDQWSAHIVNNVAQSRSATEGRQILLVYVLSIILLTVLLCLMTAFVIFSLDDLQRRREQAIRICLGQSRVQFYTHQLWLKHAYLLIALILETAFAGAFMLTTGRVLAEYYRLSLNDLLTGALLSAALHVATLVVYQYFEVRSVYRLTPAATLRA